jgi:hypothetical protein
MGSPNGSIDTTHTPPSLSFYNTFKQRKGKYLFDQDIGFVAISWVNFFPRLRF